MGLLYANCHTRQSIIDYVLGSFKKCKTNDGVESHLLDHAMHGNEIYLLMQSNKYSLNRREIIVVLIERSMIHGEIEWGYKAMGENAHPFYYNCPKRFITRCTPTTNQHAIDWRKKVMER